MLRTKYYLTDAKASGPTALYAACYLEGERKKIYLPVLTVQPAQWDKDAQKYRRNFTGFSDANHLLKRLTEALEEAHLQIIAKGKVTTLADLKAVAARVTAGKQEAPAAGLWEAMDNWIESSKRDRATSTIKAYNTLRQHLLTFSKLRRLRLEFASLDVAFCEAFKTYLLKNVGLGNSSINNQVKNLKVFLGQTFEQGVHEYVHFKRFRKLEDEAPDVVYLTAAEKGRLFALQLDHIPYLEQTRDVFLFECETGLRFSDVLALKAEQVTKDYVLVTTQKTADLLKVPLSPLAQMILARYAGRADGRALPVKSNQKTNAHLKTLAKLARIDAPTTTRQRKGSERVATTCPKYDLVATHTARRTFITLALEGGMRPETVMRITGHKDFKMLHRYVKITDAVVQDEFAQYLERQAKPIMRVAG
ncbi:site-specific integrase [Hymenobacter sp. BT770]|uniref:site-specific integrase n=1 Tax=Hymenobacter sp. BT770 TaxID=2886942 RepID=UPI001D122AE3|nr:site-specific integrase [Hymenobacter sp. BT770]MCC3152758.1 site-specific integrase [Hymenobacter sp. BT770]MDO3414833.1 site-specific integrase [Hymenobacter sp. BT770]